jgi:hypothetical protein
MDCKSDAEADYRARDIVFEIRQLALWRRRSITSEGGRKLWPGHWFHVSPLLEQRNR